MGLSRKAIEEFKEIYSQEFGQEISVEEARELAESLLSLFKVVCRPTPEEKEEQEKDNDASKSP